MTTKVCPACGAEYIATATACADCKVALVLPEPVPEGADVDEVEGGAAAGGDEGEEALDDLDGSDVDEALAYDLADWSPDQRADLTALLDTEGIPWAWDGDELLVDVADEARVEELVESIDFPDALDADGDGETADDAAELMSTLYVATDRLQGNPDHSASVMAVLEVADVAADVAPPYGIEAATWKGILEQLDALADALGGEDDPDVVQEAARSLRTTLRPYV